MIPPTKELLDSIKESHGIYKATSDDNWTLVLARDIHHAEEIANHVFDWNNVKILDASEDDFNIFVNERKATIININHEFDDVD